MSDDIVILSGARTAIGTFGGSLSGMAPIDPATAQTLLSAIAGVVTGGTRLGITMARAKSRAV